MRLHCLSAFCPLATPRGSADDKLLQFGLHCLSAFCPLATITRLDAGQMTKVLSPLPFGVLPAGYTVGDFYDGEGVVCLHCLSAFCPLATATMPKGTSEDAKVSIAFRRSARWLQKLQMNRLRNKSRSLHCLSAFCPLATGKACQEYGGRDQRLHCLSAFCPLATQVWVCEPD